MNQYDTFILLEDLNPNIKKGFEGVILEILDSSVFLVEFVLENGTNITFEGNDTFQIRPDIIKIKTAYNML